MDVNGWYVRENTFTKGFLDYVVEVKQRIMLSELGYIASQKVLVTIWKGEGYEDTKHTITYDNFEEAFKFVDEFSKQKFFDQAVEEYFKDE